ncbi:MAG: aminopeptidase P family protein [Candidatus Promineifilaceae bacterium]|nr:aminopeptidase P family protein [Candidatus Promineifilaceae bacterium]
MISIYNERLSAVRHQLAQWEADSLLIGSPANRRWLSGFTGSTGWLLITFDRALLATDSRYWEQAQQQAPEFELFQVTDGMADSWSSLFDTGGVKHLVVEGSHLAVQQYDTIRQKSAVEPLPREHTIEPLRRRKSAAEIDSIRNAAAIADEAMASVPKMIRLGMTELELAWELEKHMRELGAEAVAFPIIVAAGPNSALPHHRPGEGRLASGDAVVIDLGARLNGYHSDLTRTFYLGSEPGERFREVYETVAQAQETALNELHASLTGAEADVLSRDVIVAAGYGEHFGHSLGHGVGLEVHEAPRLSQRAPDEVIGADSVVTVEPGIYLTDWGGVRIEDLVLVTANGVELLSQSPKQPYLPL